MAQLSLAELRDRFRNAVDKEKEWREAAFEDYGFKWGTGQWSETDIATLREQRRPGLTLNKIGPLMRLLGGYQRLNRYDPILLPRTDGDLEKAKLATAVTSYVLDETDYLNEESDVFDDGVTCGRGWFGVEYVWDDETERGNIVVGSVRPSTSTRTRRLGSTT